MAMAEIASSFDPGIAMPVCAAGSRFSADFRDIPLEKRKKSR